MSVVEQHAGGDVDEIVGTSPTIRVPSSKQEMQM